MIQNVLDKKIEEWHKSDSNLELHEYLGWPKDDYDLWLETNQLPENHGLEFGLSELIIIEDITTAQENDMFCFYINNYQEKLINKDLLINVVPIRIRNDIIIPAIPCGKNRKSGSFDYIIDCKSTIEKIAVLLHGKPGFENIYERPL